MSNIVEICGHTYEVKECTASNSPCAVCREVNYADNGNGIHCLMRVLQDKHKNVHIPACEVICSKCNLQHSGYIVPFNETLNKEDKCIKVV